MVKRCACNQIDYHKMDILLSEGKCHKYIAEQCKCSVSWVSDWSKYYRSKWAKKNGDYVLLAKQIVGKYNTKRI